MPSSPDDQIVHSWGNPNPDTPRATRPLDNYNNQYFQPIPTAPLQLSPTKPPTTSLKLPIVIPATEKRIRNQHKRSSSRRRHPFATFAVISGCFAILLLTSLFVVPLDNGQQSRTLAQSFGDWISSGPLGVVNTSQHIATPTPTPAVFTNGEGYCGGTDIWGTCATAVPADGVMGTGNMIRPIQGSVITQVFAHPEYQQWCGCWKPHTGIDLAAPEGTPITAADSGQVIWTGWDWSGLGWAVKINHGHFIATIYGHLERFIVSVGQSVTQGQTIGYEGTTGASTGPHLHFMVMDNNRWVDPTKYVQLP